VVFDVRELYPRVGDMYLTGRGGYNRKGEQSASGLFLMVFGGHEFVLDHDTGRHVPVRFPLMACVRKVRMTQFGHFMMGDTVVGKSRITVSGAYGADGLPMSLEKIGNWGEGLVRLPAELEAEFWAGGGHNTAGSEVGKIREWAMVNIDALRKAR